MSLQLNLEEMIDALREVGETSQVDIFSCQLQTIGTQMAAILAQKLDVRCGPAENDLGGFCAPFYPKSADQTEPPEILARHDDGGADDWTYDHERLLVELAGEQVRSKRPAPSDDSMEP